ncbi:MAG: hypothetical protein FWG10_01535 [Eubacteriaceae bacterium]|nr:hypothetical protein [Eubacteriaceae bacterium]
MIKRKIMVAACCVLILCALAGCQLAKEGAGSNSYEDRMIGVLVTTEPLDVFGFEGYVNNNLSFPSGKGSDTNKYQGRLYAVVVPSTDTNEETGKSVFGHEYVFGNTDGIQYFVPTIQLRGADSYIATVLDPAFSDGHKNTSVGNDEHSMSIEATLFIAPSNKDHIYYFNPIYQDANGSVYAVSNYGLSVSGKDTEGFAMMQTMDQTITITENRKAKKESISIKISVSIMFAPEKIAIVQMDSDNAPISQTEFEPGKMPKDFSLETGTAYFIVETHKWDDEGSTTIHREIYGRDVENIETFFAREDGVCMKHATQITAF